MRKVALAMFGAAAMAATPANAAQYLTITGPSGVYGNDTVVCEDAPCTFEEIFQFVTPVGYNLSNITISTTGPDADTNIDFTSVTFNGVNLNLTPTGIVEFGSLINQMMVAGATNSIIVNGVAGSNASYSGTLSFTAVPEPATWGMMLFGFGMIGAAMRRRKTVVRTQIA